MKTYTNKLCPYRNPVIVSSIVKSEPQSQSQPQPQPQHGGDPWRIASKDFFWILVQSCERCLKCPRVVYMYVWIWTDNSRFFYFNIGVASGGTCRGVRTCILPPILPCAIFNICSSDSFSHVVDACLQLN